MPQRMSVRFSLTRADILRWQFYLLVRNRVLIGFMLVVSLLMAWTDLRTPQLAAHSVAYKIFYAALFTLAMFCFVGFTTTLLIVCTVFFKQHRGLLGEHELEIQDEGLVERTDVNESLHRWRGFHKIVRTRGYLYIYVTDSLVHIVPRPYFVSEEAEQAFRDDLERHIHAASSGPHPWNP